MLLLEHAVCCIVTKILKHFLKECAFPLEIKWAFIKRNQATLHQQQWQTQSNAQKHTRLAGNGLSQWSVARCNRELTGPSITDVRGTASLPAVKRTSTASEVKLSFLQCSVHIHLLSQFILIRWTLSGERVLLRFIRSTALQRVRISRLGRKMTEMKPFPYGEKLQQSDISFLPCVKAARRCFHFSQCAFYRQVQPQLFCESQHSAEACCSDENARSRIAVRYEKK